MFASARRSRTLSAGAKSGDAGLLRHGAVSLEGVDADLPHHNASNNVGLPPLFLRPTGDPRAELANGLYAGRLHLALPAVEMSLLPARLRAACPAEMSSLTLRERRNPAPSIVVARHPYRHQVVGFDYPTALGDG